MRLFPFFFRPIPHICFWVVVAAISSAIIVLFGLDPKISKLVHLSGYKWIGSTIPAVEFIYLYGPLPAIFLFVYSLTGFLLLRFSDTKERLFSVVFPSFIALLIGPILIVNLLLKNLFNRPRPSKTDLFNAYEPYVELLRFGENGESFTSGHAAAGFVLTILFYSLYHIGKKKTAYVAYAGGIIAGIILGLTRIAQGGHFLSDVLWSLYVTQISNVIIFSLYIKYLPRFKFLNLPVDTNIYRKITVYFFIGVIYMLSGFVFFTRLGI